jgi:PAS domain S-box-containing protein
VRRTLARARASATTQGRGTATREQQLREIVENAPQSIAMLDRRMCYVEASARWLKDFGLAPDIAGKSHYDVFPEIPAHWRALHQRCLDGATEHHEGEAFVRQDGSVQWLRWKMCPWREAGGEIGGLLIYSEDITEQRRAEEELRRNERRLELLSNTVPALIFHLDAEQRYVSVNDEFMKWFGVSREQVLGKSAREVVGEAAWSAIEPRMRRAYEGETVSYETEARYRSGGTRWVHVTYTPHRGPDQTVIGVVVLVTDISAIKQAEETLRASEQRFRSTFDNAAVGIGHASLEGRWLRVNDKLCAITGYSRDELLERSFRDIRYREDLDQGAQEVRQLIAGEIEIYSTELRYVCKDASLVWVNVTVSLARSASGEPDYLIKVVEDITERKRSEGEREQLMGQLRVLNTELEERVESRTRDLWAALKEREVLMQEIHHRVKNNLQVISSLIHMQMRKTEPGSNRSALEECRTRVQAIALIHEKLYQSQDYGRIPFSEYAHSLASSIFDAARVSLGQVSLEVAIEDVALPVDKAIPCGLILNELMTNSLKHAFKEGRRGTLRVEFGKVDHGRRLRLVVRDNGVGLPDGIDIQKVDSLGLQLVCTLTEQLEGDIEVGSREGASFQVTFPLKL